jgi:hypothetical protein
MNQRDRVTINKIEDPQFRKAYCVKPGFRFAALKPYCEEVEFITDGFVTDVEHIAEQIRESMKDYDPDRDVLVPTGTGIVNMLVGYYISYYFPDSSVAVAFFQREVTKFNRTVVPEDYEFYRFYPKEVLNLWE